jgi:hypothetical protein
MLGAAPVLSIRSIDYRPLTTTSRGPISARASYIFYILPRGEGVVGAPTVAFGEAPTGSIHARSVDEEKVCGRCLGVAQISRLVNFW